VLRIYGCIVDQHDLRLVVLAGLICLFASFTATSLIVRARQSDNSTRNVAWLSVAAVVFQLGRVDDPFSSAELAYMPGVPVGYDIGFDRSLIRGGARRYLCGDVSSALRYGSWSAGGAIIGAGVGGMHYVGMAAMRVAADFHWDVGYVAASLGVGGLLAAAAMHVLSRGTAWRYRIGATLAPGSGHLRSSLSSRWPPSYFS